MNEQYDHAEARGISTDERSNTSQQNTWVIGSDRSGCDHDEKYLRHVGDDGLTSYYRCERCGSVLVSREPIRRAVQPIN